jgi:hypothetical protein
MTATDTSVNACCKNNDGTCTNNDTYEVEDDGDDSSSSSSETMSTQYPLFMNSLPRDFSTNPHLSALASFISFPNNDDDTNEAITSPLPTHELTTDDNNNDDEVDEVNENEMNDEDDDSNNDTNYPSHREDAMVPMASSLPTLAPTISGVVPQPYSAANAITKRRQDVNIVTSSSTHPGNGGGGKVISSMHWKSKQQSSHRPNQPYFHKNHIVNKPKKHDATTTLGEAQLYLKMWKL